MCSPFSCVQIYVASYGIHVDCKIPAFIKFGLTLLHFKRKLYYHIVCTLYFRMVLSLVMRTKSSEMA